MKAPNVENLVRRFTVERTQSPADPPAKMTSSGVPKLNATRSTTADEGLSGAAAHRTEVRPPRA